MLHNSLVRVRSSAADALSIQSATYGGFAHLYDKLYQTKVEQGFEPVVQLIIRFARSCQSFHRVNAADADIVFGFSSGHPWVRVLAIFGNVRSPNRFDENVIAASYDVEKGRWPDLEDYEAVGVQRHGDRVLCELKRRFSWG